MAEQAPPFRHVQVPVELGNLDDVPVHMANQFVLQYHDDGFILTVGQIVPPVLLGTPEEQIEQAKAIKSVTARVLGRFSMTPERLSELVNLLSDQKVRYAKTAKEKASAD